MLLGLAYQLTRFLTDLILVRTRSAQLRAEVRLVSPAAEAGDLAPLAPRLGRAQVGGLSAALSSAALSSAAPSVASIPRWIAAWLGIIPATRSGGR
jgi:hypothetical protein